MTDVLGARLAALEPDHGLRFGLAERMVFDHQDAVAQISYVGAVDLLVGELPVAGGSFYPGDRTRENNAELPLQPRAGFALVRQFYDQRMYTELDSIHLPGGSARGAGQLSHGVYARMRDDPARVWLYARAEGPPPLSQPIREFLGGRGG